MSNETGTDDFQKVLNNTVGENGQLAHRILNRVTGLADFLVGSKPRVAPKQDPNRPDRLPPCGFLPKVIDCIEITNEVLRAIDDELTILKERLGAEPERSTKGRE